MAKQINFFAVVNQMKLAIKLKILYYFIGTKLCIENYCGSRLNLNYSINVFLCAKFWFSHLRP